MCSSRVEHSSTQLSCVVRQQKKDVRMLRFIQEVNTTTRSCALWDLEEETDYIVHVQSISMFGTSPQSEPLRFRTPKEAETHASKNKGKVSRITWIQIGLYRFCVFVLEPEVAEWSRPLDEIMTDFVQTPIKINKNTKREMKFHKSAQHSQEGVFFILYWRGLFRPPFWQPAPLSS